MKLRPRTIIGLLTVAALCFGFFWVRRDSDLRDSIEKKNTLVLNFGSPPLELHPQFLHDVHSAILAIHIYEGLFRAGPDRTILPGLAEDLYVSEDGLRYRIQLRKSYWSNGLPVTAHDFVRSWRNAIDPIGGRSCYGSMHFDFISGVEDFRNGKSSWSNVALVAEDDSTLLFTLKHPVPYFKDLLTLPVFYPVYPDYNMDDELITNGPFYLKGSKWGQSLVIQKNPFYWDSSSIHLSQIKFMFVESAETQTLLFERGELDSIGGGLVGIPQEEVDRLLPSGSVSDQYDVASVTYLTLNTSIRPFSSSKIRLAFSMALDREEMARGIFKRSFSAYSYLPPSLSTRKHVRLINESQQLARQFLEEGLQELGMPREELGEIRLLCSENAIKLAQALQRQWAEKLGVLISIESSEFRSILARLSEGDFHFSINSSVADYRDPYTFFESFMQGEFESNYTAWSPETMRELFQDGFGFEGDERIAHLESMEDFFLAEMPLIPIAFTRDVCAMQHGLKGVQLSDMLLIDFSRAYWD
ncbi:peptide ABC transporter substrate-binding protein [Candidatus Similichlamydia epinepheli]|uniref:peptide ABC transporter substrate-binding protein n=1 Tax=Candidatus Similichlamydia epinepheli TaxID=1903953 RepID=UPI000D3DA192|nr:peptide ABC transporter substrate-binding protein [Candidatus Similichlamydia epinepheli]